MNTKKILLAAISAAMLTVMVGCGNDISTVSSSAPAATSAVSQESKSDDSTAATPAGSPSFTAVINGTEIAIDAECDPIIEKLGEPKETFEAPSCAFEGKSYTYTYDGFKVETYPNNDANRVYAVMLTDATQKTAEGLAVGATAEEIITACGEATVETDTLIVYAGDGIDLQFFMEDEKVTSIVYTYHVG